MPNFKIDISYDGTNYFGWQIQKHELTIQGEIESALYKIFKNDSINCIGSGRTDTGVHAYHQIANIKVDTLMCIDEFRNALNANINNDIFINSCEIVKDDFHARFSAIKREYVYFVEKKYSPINRHYCWQFNGDIDCELLTKCANLLLGKHDFSAFCKVASLKENNDCHVYQSKWFINKDSLEYKIVANRFLHHMVRFLVGTMINVSQNKVDFKEFERILKNGRFENLINKAPAKGLFLHSIYYNEK